MTKRNKIIIIVAAVALFVIGAGVFIGVVFFSPMSDPLYVAHRGYRIIIVSYSFIFV